MTHKKYYCREIFEYTELAPLEKARDIGFLSKADGIMTVLANSKYVNDFLIQGDESVVLGNTNRYISIRFADDVQLGRHFKLYLQLFIKGQRGDNFLIQLYPRTEDRFGYHITDGIGRFSSYGSPRQPEGFPDLYSEVDVIADFHLPELAARVKAEHDARRFPRQG